MYRTEIIQKIIDKLNSKTYFEIGVGWGGPNFKEVNVENKIGIDPLSPNKELRKILNKNIRYFQMTSDEFFATKAPILFDEKKIDVAFIDGLHYFKQVLKDVKNCLNYLNEKGVILIHDCNPNSREMQVVPRTQFEWTGDVWKAVVHLRSLFKDINVFVLNCDYGLGIVTKEKPEGVLEYSKKAIEKMTYEYLDRKRKKLLNLKEEEYFNQFLDTATFK